ncbi:MAG: hypothetical protein IJ379_03355 [Lachnospiraceae bacterium]|nr:hypothetical protein [Lachnospiraceae bacterium]
MSILQKGKQNRIQLLVLLLVAVVHLAFISTKEGYHMDELLSFELANAEYNPWIVPTQPQGRLAKFMQEEIDGETFAETVGNFVDVVKDVLVNRGSSKLLTYKADVYEEPVWIDRATFEAYETTGQRDRFNLLSVYFNVKDDNHPPVHFMLLHLMSSLFPGRVSVWLGCLINVASLLGICVLMMKGGNLLEKHGVVSAEMGQAWGICAALLYGLSSGAIATTLLIRMYGVMTFLCVWSLYLHVKKWLEGNFDKKNKLLILATILGFLTQYFFLFYCILLAAVTFVLLWMHKRKREAWIYVRSMVISAVIGVCLYPFAISHVFSSGRGVEALNNLGAGLGDFVERMVVFGSMVLERCFSFTGLGVMLLIVGVLYLVWLLKEKCFGQKWLVWMLLMPPVGYFLLAAKMSPMYVDRYVMAVFPFLLMAMAAVLVGVASKLGQFHMPVGLAVLVVAGSVAVFTYNGEYLYKGYEKQLALAEKYRELPCICLYEGVGFYDNLLEFMEYEETLLVKPSELEGRRETSDIEALEKVVVLLKPTVEDAKGLEILSSYGLQVQETLLEDSVYGDRIYLLGKE